MISVSLNLKIFSNISPCDDSTVPSSSPISINFLNSPVVTAGFSSKDDLRKVLVIILGIRVNVQTAGPEAYINPLIIFITNRDHLSAILVEIDFGVNSPKVTISMVEITVEIITPFTDPWPTKFIIKALTSVAIKIFSKFPNNSKVPKNFSFSLRVFSIALAFLLP